LPLKSELKLIVYEILKFDRPLTKAMRCGAFSVYEKIYIDLLFWSKAYRRFKSWVKFL